MSFVYCSPLLLHCVLCQNARWCDTAVMHTLSHTSVSDISERCVLVSRQNSHFLYLAATYWQFCTPCIWSLTKLLQTRLKSPFFVHTSWNYLRTCHPLSPKFEHLEIVLPERCKKVPKTCQTILRGPVLPGMSEFLTFFIFHALQNVGKVHFAS